MGLGAANKLNDVLNGVLFYMKKLLVLDEKITAKTLKKYAEQPSAELFSGTVNC